MTNSFLFLFTGTTLITFWSLPVVRVNEIFINWYSNTWCLTPWVGFTIEMQIYFVVITVLGFLLSPVIYFFRHPKWNTYKFPTCTSSVLCLYTIVVVSLCDDNFCSVDLELQLCMTELIFRMLPYQKRRSYANQWFQQNSECHDDFVSIRDAEFESVRIFAFLQVIRKPTLLTDLSFRHGHAPFVGIFKVIYFFVNYRMYCLFFFDNLSRLGLSNVFE